MNCLSLALALTLVVSSTVPASAMPPLPLLPAADPPAVETPVEMPSNLIQPGYGKDGLVVYQTKIPVLMYHHIVPDGKECNEMTITAGRLEQDFQWLADNGYHTVLPRELAAGIPLQEKTVLITFDDGYASNYYFAYPLLQRYQFKAAIALMVYMPDNHADNFLSWDMCREMTDSGLVEIGSHGYVIHNLDDRMGNFVAGQANGVQRRKGESDAAFKARVLDDLMKSYNRIAVETGVPPTFFAYPFGKTDPDADAFLNALFPLTVITGPGKYYADLSGGLHGLPRYTITMKDSPKTFLKAN